MYSWSYLLRKRQDTTVSFALAAIDTTLGHGYINIEVGGCGGLTAAFKRVHGCLRNITGY